MGGSLLVAAMLADARLPTGAHAHSAGLEPALLGGLPESDIAAYAASRLRTVTATEAAAAVVARHHRLHGLPLADVEDAWAARTPSPAVRGAATHLGRGYLRLAEALWPEQVRGAFAPGSAPPRPLVLGVIGAAAGLSAREVALLTGYDDAQTVAAAALKLVPMDPLVATRWVLDLHPAIEALADQVEHLTDPSRIPARGAPVIDGDAERHAVSSRRLFRG